MRAIPLTLGIFALAAAWLGPLPTLARQSFSAHMAMHMAVVAVAAPLVALSVSNRLVGSTSATRLLRASIPASIVEFIVVWSWHTPALHHAARHETWALVVEQATFFATGLFLWVAVLPGRCEKSASQSGAGVVALLFTSMHMTLLGALFALAPRPLYPHVGNVSNVLAPIADQHLGGAIMLLAGGMSYLIGGLWLTSTLLRGWRAERREAW